MKRWILIGLAVLVGLLVIVDVAGRFVAEAATAKALESSLDLSAQPKVTIGGVPFLPHLASGDFPTVTVEGEQVESGQIMLQSVHADLHDVHVPVMDLARGHRVQVTAATGTGSAVVSAAEITRVLQKRGTGVNVEFDQGQVRVQVPDIPAFLVAEVAVESGQLVVRSPSLPSIGVTLPQVVPGVRYTSVRVGNDTAVVRFDLRNATFDVGG
jgi:LmeA-like phospholipid-binding